MKLNEIGKISIIGPESTGKTTLSQQLAQHFQTIWLPEYARTYVENLDREYNYDDVIFIAKKQIQLEKEYTINANKFLFLDTDLIITKIWLQVVYKNYPTWLDSEILKNANKLYLLCFYDLPWIKDNVRENGGEKRKSLFEMYQTELVNYNFNYEIIIGKDSQRFELAVKKINNFFSA